MSCSKTPAFAKAFAGRWRIVDMDVWDNDVIDEIEAAHITFGRGSNGEFAFIAVSGELDVRYGSRDGSASAEFPWHGSDDGEDACGRGWVMIGTAGHLVGHIYIHKGGDSGFVCERD